MQYGVPVTASVHSLPELEQGHLSPALTHILAVSLYIPEEEKLSTKHSLSVAASHITGHSSRYQMQYAIKPLPHFFAFSPHIIPQSSQLALHTGRPLPYGAKPPLRLKL
jgi:hypothetical protein